MKIINVVVDEGANHRLIQRPDAVTIGSNVSFRCHSYLATAQCDQPDAFGYVRVEQTAAVGVNRITARTNVEDIESVSSDATW
jgi:hypothetical protein